MGRGLGLGAWGGVDDDYKQTMGMVEQAKEVGVMNGRWIRHREVRKGAG